ncbi:MAG: sugar phosphate isomerase/epimerase [Lachnospiraceae bacterium]|nr:sugar phosphate isomerase/epimerase [Lachnospiraceae bacterium]
MKLGLLSAILGDMSFEGMIEYASKVGYECVEVACWPKGKANRKYAGVTHIDADTFNDNVAEHIQEHCKIHNIELSALSYYGNPLAENEEVAKASAEHTKKLIKVANALGIDCVGAFIGRSEYKNVEENLERFKKVWIPIIDEAEKNNVKIVIENCPMLFTKNEWPGGQNLAATPDIWRKMFDEIPSKNLGLNYDPSHFIWQQMDYIKPLYEFKDRIYHLHFKDIKLYKEKLADVGIMAYPLNYMSPKLPGLGDVDWGKFASALYDIGYDGPACVEIEDTAFEGSQKGIKRAVEQSYKYMRQFIA